MSTILTSTNKPAQIRVKQLLAESNINLKDMVLDDFIKFMKNIPETPIKRAILEEYNSSDTTRHVTLGEVPCENNCSVTLNQVLVSPPVQLITSTASVATSAVTGTTEILKDTTVNVLNAIISLKTWFSQGGGRRRSHRQRRMGRTRHKKRSYVHRNPHKKSWVPRK